MHEKYLELGLESPYEGRRLELIYRAEPVTTTIAIDGYQTNRDRALLAHETQIDPESPWWFGLSEEIRHEIYPFEDYRLAKSRVGSLFVSEHDLFDAIG